jgi:hypothetical protein
LGVRVWGLAFRFDSSGFMIVQDFGFRVYSIGFRISPLHIEGVSVQ